MKNKNPKSRRSARAIKTELKKTVVQQANLQPVICENTASKSYTVAYDENLLGKYRGLWQSGDWESLVTLDIDILEHHPDRAKLALIIASAWLQLNDHSAARRFVKLAGEWGCDKKLIAQLLIAGVHNTLGRAAAINQDENCALEHFQSAVKGVHGNVKRVGEARALQELAQLGLLPQSAQLLPQQQNGTTTRLFTIASSASESRASVSTKSVNSFAGILRFDLLDTPNIPLENSTDVDSSDDAFYEGIVSYAQNFEDVMLWRALRHIKEGFYIDVGAQDPIVDSVSKAFYEHGWRGIHVEATPHYAELLRQDRPDELVLQAALTDVQGEIVFYEIPETGISTGDPVIAKSHQHKGFPVHEITVPCMTLADVFAKAGGRDIHWLKIDVEGMEYQVLAGWGETKAKPWIVVVESTLPNTQIETHEKWEYLLRARGYEAIYFDGLSRFYVSEDHMEFANAFRSGPNVFDNFALSGSGGPYCSLINRKLKQKEQEVIELHQALAEQQTKNHIK